MTCSHQVKKQDIARTKVKSICKQTHVQSFTHRCACKQTHRHILIDVKSRWVCKAYKQSPQAKGREPRPLQKARTAYGMSGNESQKTVHTIAGISHPVSFLSQANRSSSTSTWERHRYNCKSLLGNLDPPPTGVNTVNNSF